MYAQIIQLRPRFNRPNLSIVQKIDPSKAQIIESALLCRGYTQVSKWSDCHGGFRYTCAEPYKNNRDVIFYRDKGEVEIDMDGDSYIHQTFDEFLQDICLYCGPPPVTAHASNGGTPNVRQLFVKALS